MTFISKEVDVTVDVEVEVNIEDFDLDDIREEYFRRSFGRSEEGFARDLFEAFKIGDTERAMNLAKEYAQEMTGGILP